MDAMYGWVGYIWVDGCYIWVDGCYIWVGGCYVWVDGCYIWVDGCYIWVDAMYDTSILYRMYTTSSTCIYTCIYR